MAAKYSARPCCREKVLVYISVSAIYFSKFWSSWYQNGALQLRVARQVDLSIPETHITNDPEAARVFVLRHDPENVIRKAFRNIEQAPRQTSVLTEDDLSVIDSVRFAPVTFQRYVPPDLDLRIMVVGRTSSLHPSVRPKSTTPTIAPDSARLQSSLTNYPPPYKRTCFN